MAGNHWLGLLNVTLKSLQGFQGVYLRDIQVIHLLDISVLVQPMLVLASCFCEGLDIQFDIKQGTFMLHSLLLSL